jgi:hypothetical protein
MRFLSLALLLTLLSGCAYQVPVRPAPALDVYASYGDKVPGKFALYIDAASFNRVIVATGQICSAHKFPVNANEAFRLSAVETMKQLVEEVEVVDAPISRPKLAGTGYKGMIVLKSDEYTARLMFIQNFWSATATASADMSASVLVDGPQERLFGTSASASRSFDATTSGCDEGAGAIGEATALAMKEMLERLGERFANSPRLREG